MTAFLKMTGEWIGQISKMWKIELNLGLVVPPARDA
jgi:hypothetical protein